MTYRSPLAYGIDYGTSNSAVAVAYPDGVEVAARAGVRAIVQPGGSVKDSEAIAAADAAGVAMVLTGERHFKH